MQMYVSGISLGISENRAFLPNIQILETNFDYVKLLQFVVVLSLNSTSFIHHLYL